MLPIQTLTILSLFCLIGATFAKPRCCPTLVGGIGQEQPADREVDDVLRSVHQQFEDEYGDKFESLKAVSYRKQIVAGWNYFIKVVGDTEAGEKKYAQVKIYKPLKDPLKLIELRKDVEPDSVLWSKNVAC